MFKDCLLLLSFLIIDFLEKNRVETMARGYEGTSDMGVNMTKEQRATISSITIEIDEIR
ncbi:MAG: hypothetical protein ACJA0U_000853 [Salibacteraceae bacterium]